MSVSTTELRFFKNHKVQILHDIGVIFASTSISLNDTKLLLQNKQPKNFVLTFDKDVMHALNNAWHLLMTNMSPINIDLLKMFNKLIAFDALDPGHFAQQPMSISGVKYHPDMPSINEAKNIIQGTLNEQTIPQIVAIHLMLRLCRAQLFWDGNKRTAFFIANYYLLHHNAGLLWIKPAQQDKWNHELLKFYNTGRLENITHYLLQGCILKL